MHLPIHHGGCFSVGGTRTHQKGNHMPTIEVSIADLILRDSFKTRITEKQETVDLYAGWIAEGREPPPLNVIREQGTGKLLLSDGRHRRKALLQVGRTSAMIDVTDGTEFDALVLSCESNAMHGLAPSSADRRLAIEQILSTPQGYEMSNRKIAELAGSSHPTVGRIREELYPTGTIKTVARPVAEPVAVAIDDALGYDDVPEDLDWDQPPSAISHIRAAPSYHANGSGGNGGGSRAHRQGNGSSQGYSDHGIVALTITYMLDGGAGATVDISEAHDLPDIVKWKLRGIR
jgi:hypothetical protein